jgi:hypothetical protein
MILLHGKYEGIYITEREKNCAPGVLYSSFAIDGLPSHANFLIPRITILLAGITHPVIALGSITQVQMVPED